MTTSTIDQTILQKLDLLSEQVKQLTREVASLKSGVHINEPHDPVVATHVEDGITFTVTQSEAAAMRNSLRKKSTRRPDELIHEMVLIEKIAPHRQERYTEEELKTQFFETIEAIRAEAVENGTAIDEEWEAAIDD